MMTPLGWLHGSSSLRFHSGVKARKFEELKTRGWIRLAGHLDRDECAALAKPEALPWSRMAPKVGAVTQHGWYAQVPFQQAPPPVQTLGGIGFTWEHDAHIYLKRALSVRQLVGRPEAWHRKVSALALSGTRRQLQLDLPARADAFRQEVRQFAESLAGLDRAEQRKRVVDAGYFVPHWPPPWGRNAGAVEQLVIDEEFRKARIRRPNLAVGAWAAPTIVANVVRVSSAIRIVQIMASSPSPITGRAAM